MILKIPGTDLPDPTCGLMIGNGDIKKIMLYAFARYYEGDPKSITPIFIMGLSGEGKTHILRCLKRVFGGKLLNKSGMTAASATSLQLKGLYLFDEMSAWSVDTMSALLAIFGAEDIQRARKDLLKNITPRCMPVGCLLTNWETLESSPASAPKKEIIFQLLRRSTILALEKVTQTTELQREYIEHVVAEKFNIETGKGDSIHETAMALRELLLQTSELCNNGFQIENKSVEKIKDYIATLMLHLRISDTVSYEETIPYIVLNLAQGRALCHKRNIVQLDDINEICSILTKHSKKLGFWKEDKDVTK